MHTFIWKDESRVTPGVRGVKEKPSRELKVWAWVGPMGAKEAGTYPLLLMAHGLGGHPEKFRAFAEAIAQQGIVVAALRFPVTHRDAEGGFASGMFDLSRQPGDMKFVTDRLLEAAKDAKSPLFRRFHPERLVALGHSLGGATVLGLTRFDCCQDKRFRASILVAPATNFNLVAFQAPNPSKEGPPTLLIHGQKDEVLKYEVSEALYPLLAPPRYFLGLSSATHTNLLEVNTRPTPAEQIATQRAVAAFVKEILLKERGATLKVLEELKKQGHTVKVDEGK